MYKLFKRGNRKGFIAAGPMDIYAIIFFVLIVIVFTVIFAIASKGKSGGRALQEKIGTIERQIDGNIMLQNYLRTKIEYNKKIMTIAELITQGEKMNTNTFDNTVAKISQEVLNPFLGEDNYRVSIAYPKKERTINQDRWKAFIESRFGARYAIGDIKIPSEGNEWIEISMNIYGTTQFEGAPVDPSTLPTAPATQVSLSANLQGCNIQIPAIDSKSIGTPTSGRVENDAVLPFKGEYHYVKSNSIGRNRNFGTVELVTVIQGAGCILKRETGIKLNVGDLNKKGGGEVSGHASHESGRDVDIGLVCNKDGKLYGCWENLAANRNRFDPAANYVVAKSFVENSNVKFIFLDQRLINILAAWAKNNEPDEKVRKKVIGKLVHWKNHHHHFHVRLHCPKDDKPQCRG